MTTLRAGLFLDLDGTLADSLGVMRDVYARFMAENGLSASDAEFDELNGPPLERVIAILRDRHRLSAPLPAVVARYKELVRELYLDVAANDGAAEILAHARERGWAAAVVTSNSERLARDWLRRRGLDVRVDAVVGEESIRIGKPDPEPYVTALARLGCVAASSIAVEDSAAGLSSAEAAGLRVFALVPGGAASPHEGRCEVIGSLCDLVGRLSDER